MTQVTAEGLFLVLLCCLYWACRDRRRHLQSRIGRQAFRNTYEVGRNIFFMLRKNRLRLTGDTSVLNRGCILYSFHFGVWESMPCTLKRLGYKVGIIVNRYYKPGGSILARLCDYLLLRWRSAAGVKVFYAENTLGIVRFLKSGGIFGMLVDGNTLHQKEGKARKLATICRVPLVPFAAYRSKGQGILEIGCDLASIIGAKPLDYLWAYRSR
ncbi:hypothetical protein IBX73_07260 [candidate division WOR-3 bacterium]|nr:hypothetical protein [candidate division WOR-3 bacterium]